MTSNVMPAGMSPSRTHHVRDGVTIACVGVLGWGFAFLAGNAGWALLSVLAGLAAGAAVVALGQRRARRAELVARAGAALLPMLGLPGKCESPLRASQWTNRWPGVPRRVRLTYGTGRVKALGSGVAGVELGESRWAGEVARVAGSYFGQEFAVATNDSRRGRLKLRACEREIADEVTEAAAVGRARKVVNDLLGGTATVTRLEASDDGEVSQMVVDHEVGAKLVAPGYRRRIERSVSVMLPGRWRAQWDMESDRVTFEVRPTLPDSIWIPPLAVPDEDPLTNYRSVKVPYGVDEDGTVMTWQPATNPQWLITGTTGSGKTSTTHGILAQITQYGWPVWIADGKGVEFLGFRDWPNIQVVASKIEQQVAVIHRAWEVMEGRYQLVVDGLARTEDFEPLVVFVDEFTDLKANLLTWYGSVKVKGDPAKPTTLVELGSIARKGRTSRVHLVLAMQRPDAEILSGENRENYGQRTSMGPLSPEGAQMMWNNPVTGVALPRGRIGRAIGVNEDGQPVEMQCYRVPDPKETPAETPEGELLEQLRPAEARHERLVIVPPEIDWDSGEDPVEPTFSDFAGAEWARASDRPDLDPLSGRRGSETADGRALSSPTALLGLAADAPRPRPRPSAVKRSESSGGSSGPEVEDASSGIGQETDGEALESYGGIEHVSPAGLKVGDLVRVDEELDEWAVVEDEPLTDFDDEESVVVAWRDDQDSRGELIVAGDSVIPVRHPLEVG